MKAPSLQNPVRLFLLELLFALPTSLAFLSQPLSRPLMRAFYRKGMKSSVGA